MGFRSLHDFNLALLAKQGWKLITNPNSLMTRLLKSSYYPSSTSLLARRGYRPSFIWKGIWTAVTARPIIEKGWIWKIVELVQVYVVDRFLLHGC